MDTYWVMAVFQKKRLIKLCDGHPNPAYTKYSLLFLESIKDYIKNKFNLPSKVTKINNKYELVLTSKYFCRFLIFFYNFKKDKKIIKKPDIIKDSKEKSCIFYRGFFDADAGIKVKDKFLALKCTDENFLKLCKEDFENYKIKTSKISYDNLNIPSFRIYSQNLYNYAKHIGFYHPKKQEILVDHLKKGCLIKKLHSVNKSNLLNSKFYNLSLIQDLRIKGASDIFRKYRQQIGTQKYVATLLKTFRENIKRWELGIDSIPFDCYFKLMKLNGLSLINLIDGLSKRKVFFGKGKLKQYIRLPILFKKSHFETFQYMNPTTNKIIIKSYGLDDRDIDRSGLYKKIYGLFNAKIIKDGGSHIICSNLLSEFLSTFYKYTPSWRPLSDNEISILKKKWKVF